MKKPAILFLAAALPIFAQSRGVGLELGYTHVDFQDIDNVFKDWENWLEANPRNFSVNREEFGSAFYFSAFYDHPIRQQLVIGPKLEYLRVFSSEFEATLPGTSWKSVMSAWLLPVMFGAKYYLPLPNPVWSFSGGLYLGAALCGSLQEVDQDNYYGLSNDYELPARGSGWIAELELKAEYRFSSQMSLVAGLAYRACDIDEMSYTENVQEPGVDVEDGDDIEDQNGHDVQFDYSGVKLGVGVKLGL